MQGALSHIQTMLLLMVSYTAGFILHNFSWRKVTTVMYSNLHTRGMVLLLNQLKLLKSLHNQQKHLKIIQKKPLEWNSNKKIWKIPSSLCFGARVFLVEFYCPKYLFKSYFLGLICKLYNMRGLFICSKFQTKYLSTTIYSFIQVLILTCVTLAL